GHGGESGGDCRQSRTVRLWAIRPGECTERPYGEPRADRSRAIRGDSSPKGFHAARRVPSPASANDASTTAVGYSLYSTAFAARAVSQVKKPPASLRVSIL